MARAHDHSSTKIEAETTHALEIGTCSGLNVKVHYKVDGYYYTSSAWDTIPPVSGAFEDVAGWDVFYYSDHNARPTGETYWIAGRKYH